MDLWKGASLWHPVRIGCCRAVVGAIGVVWRGLDAGRMSAIAWQAGASVEDA